MMLLVAVLCIVINIIQGDNKDYSNSRMAKFQGSGDMTARGIGPSDTEQVSSKFSPVLRYCHSPLQICPTCGS